MDAIALRAAIEEELRKTKMLTYDYKAMALRYKMAVYDLPWWRVSALFFFVWLFKCYVRTNKKTLLKAALQIALWAQLITMVPRERHNSMKVYCTIEKETKITETVNEINLRIMKNILVVEEDHGRIKVL